MKNILLLGGTLFVGRAIIEALQATNKNYKITLFNRNISNPQATYNLPLIVGNRNEAADIEQLTNLPQTWDCVIDTSGYFPIPFEKLVQKLQNKVKRYIYISTASVYNYDFFDFKNLINEDFELLKCTPEQAADPDLMPTYGQKKAACEQVLRQHANFETFILRPSIIYGKYDYTDRFYYYLYQLANNQPVILHNNATELFNLTYIEDLAQWVAHCIEQPSTQQHHIYNTVSYAPKTLYNQVVETILTVINPPLAHKLIHYLPQAQLEENGIQLGHHLPLSFGGNYLFFDNQKILKDIDYKPIDYKTSIQNTVNFYTKNGWHTPKVGLPTKKINQLLNLS